MRTHLSQKEYSALQTLFAMVAGFDACSQVMRKRCEEAGCLEQMETVGRMAGECMDAILRTDPENKLRHINADLRHIRIMTKIEPPGLETWVRGFSYTPTDALNGLLNHLCETECMLCDKTAVEARHCPHRKLIEDSLPHDVDAPEREHCKYSDMVLGVAE
jgi:hypothetical protein